jgi:hypothetical protein
MNRKKRKAKGKTENRATVIWLIIMTLFIGELFLYTWLRVQCTAIGYSLSRETGRHQKLLALQQSLQVERDSKKSPEIIAQKARQQLGLVTPNPEQTVTLP